MSNDHDSFSHAKQLQNSYLQMNHCIPWSDVLITMTTTFSLLICHTGKKDTANDTRDIYRIRQKHNIVTVIYHEARYTIHGMILRLIKS